MGTAAGPLGEDDIDVAVTVADEAALRLRSAAATILYAGPSSRQCFDVTVGRGARLDWHPEPLIATAGCCHAQHTYLRVGNDADVDWTEEVLLGRHGERPGLVDLRFDVDVDGTPLLRHQLVIGGPGWDGPAGVGGHRSVGLRLVLGGDLPPGQGLGAGRAWLDLDGPGRLLVAVAGSLPELRARMDEGAPLLG